MWSEETSFIVPTEVTEDRIGYIAVQLNNELNEATLLGFYPSLDNSQTSIAIDDLQSLDDFIDYRAHIAITTQMSTILKKTFSRCMLKP